MLGEENQIRKWKPDRMAERDEHLFSCFGRFGEFKPYGFEPGSTQTNDLKVDTCRSLAWCSALLGWGKEQ